jgi:glutamyl-tRNA synthetase
VQLDHWQREAVRRLDPRAAAQWLAAEFPSDWPDERRQSVAALLQGNVLLPGEARGWLAVLDGTLPPLPAEAENAIVEAGPAFFDAALAT